MFTDCIVRNRGAIAEPWREYRTEGNRYFVLQLVITFCSLIACGGLALIFVLGHWEATLVTVTLLILFGVAFLLVAIVVALVMRFMVPVMYRQALRRDRCLWSGLDADHRPSRSLYSLRSFLPRDLHRGRDDRLSRRLRHLLHRGPALHRDCHPPAGGDMSVCLSALFPAAIRRPLRRLGRR